MTDADTHTMLSVRGEARRIVAADQATIVLYVSATGDIKRAAASDVAGALAEITAALADLSGEVLTAETIRAPLTWSTQSIQTSEEHSHDKVTGVHGPTSRHLASVVLLINVRDFTLLGRLEATITEHDTVNVLSVQWSVDDDNPAWALVRADAIHAALLKGRDYAAALGGSVLSVEHVADAGLLGGDAWHDVARKANLAVSAAAHGGQPEGASLDPVPQVLSATIDARLAAAVGSVPTGRAQSNMD
jgi:uncharacterized protein YggE